VAGNETYLVLFVKGLEAPVFKFIFVYLWYNALNETIYTDTHCHCRLRMVSHVPPQLAEGCILQARDENVGG